ncbi:MAG: glycoside hydrolase family 32 protein [Draconibacterium sp.]
MREGTNNQQQQYYTEKYRPQFHFSPEKKWMNDPNGMFYYEGEYHLFYQYYPDSTVWGPMHWGHAISKDLVHWEHQAIALYPDSLGMIFSGSAVVDWNNTSRLSSTDTPPLVAIYTIHNKEGEDAGGNDYQMQGVAYSLDKGRTWTKYANNPVLKNPGIRDFRDPKVTWHEVSKKWVMTLAVQDHVEFYTSPNLIDWTKASEFGADLGAHGGVWECPDLFEIEIQGSDESRWVLLVSINPGGPNGGSATQYFVGDFDGSKFTTAQTATKWLDYGRDNYAGVTWSDVPANDGRRLFIGWMSNWSYANVVPTEKWRSAMTIPRELVLEEVNGDLIVASVPVVELQRIINHKVELSSEVISGQIQLETKDIEPMRSEMKFSFQLEIDSQNDAPEELGVELKNDLGENFKIGYLPAESIFYIDRTNGGVHSFSDNFAGKHTAQYEAGETIEIHLFVDEASIEVFVDGGLLVFTDIVFPSVPYDKIGVFSNNGSIKLQKGEIWSLNSIWKP